MKIVTFSDTHGSHRKVKLPKGDILIFAGDLCADGRYIQEYEDFNNWLGEQDFVYKLLIAGNHDTLLESLGSGLIKTLFSNATYLFNEGVTINGIKFWGSPFTPIFNNWAFMGSIDELREIWAKIPEDTDVLITHGPVFGILDKTEIGVPTHVGCPALKDKIKKVKPKIHIFGHIHEGYGKIEDENIAHYNVSILNAYYEIENSPVEIVIEPIKKRRL